MFSDLNNACPAKPGKNHLGLAFDQDPVRQDLADALHMAVKLVTGEEGTQHCFFYAFSGALFLTTLTGKPYQIQAGSLALPRPSDEKLCYVFDAEEGNLEKREVHVWIGLAGEGPATQELVDFSARHFPQIARACFGEWKGPACWPDYIWSGPDRVPPYVAFETSPKAILFAYRLLLGQPQMIATVKEIARLALFLVEQNERYKRATTKPGSRLRDNLKILVVALGSGHCPGETEG